MNPWTKQVVVASGQGAYWSVLGSRNSQVAESMRSSQLMAHLVKISTTMYLCGGVWLGWGKG